MVHADDSLMVNPCCCVFVLKIGVKGWDLLVVFPWFCATCSIVFQIILVLEEEDVISFFKLLPKTVKISVPMRNLS